MSNASPKTAHPSVRDAVFADPMATLVFAEHGVPFVVRLVRKGDPYGSYDAGTGRYGWKHDNDKPLLIFYDARWPHQPHGQQISAYYFETVKECAEAGEGINLHGSEAEWTIDAEALHAAYDVMRAALDYITRRDSMLPFGDAPKSPGQLTYEQYVQRRPTYPDGSRRAEWSALSEIAQRSWEPNVAPPMIDLTKGTELTVPGTIRGPHHASPGDPNLYAFSVRSKNGWVPFNGATEAQARARAEDFRDGYFPELRDIRPGKEHLFAILAGANEEATETATPRCA